MSLVLALAIGLVLVVAACGGSDSEALPACARAGKAVPLPAFFPKQFPFPPGTIIDSSHPETGGFRAVEGHVPGALGAMRDYLRRELPRRGFELGEGDAEEHEAETEFTGHGVEGRLKLRDVDGCAGALTLAVAVKRL